MHIPDLTRFFLDYASSKTVYHLATLRKQECSICLEPRYQERTYKRLLTPIAISFTNDDNHQITLYTQINPSLDKEDGDGISYYKATDLMQSKWFAKNGNLYGIKETWAFDGHQKQRSYYNEVGKLHGVIVEWRDSGMIVHATYSNGMLHGPITCYMGGILPKDIIAQWTCILGKKWGVEEQFYQGQIKVRTHWENNLKHGTEEYYHEDSRIDRTFIWDHDEVEDMVLHVN